MGARDTHWKWMQALKSFLPAGWQPAWEPHKQSFSRKISGLFCLVHNTETCHSKKLVNQCLKYAVFAHLFSFNLFILIDAWLFYNIVVDFAIHLHESATGAHLIFNLGFVFKISVWLSVYFTPTAMIKNKIPLQFQALKDDCIPWWVALKLDFYRSYSLQPILNVPSCCWKYAEHFSCGKCARNFNSFT